MPLRGLDVQIFGDSYQKYPPNLYWNELKNLLDIYSLFPKIKFILKLYSTNNLNNNPVQDYLKVKGIKNVVVRKRPQFQNFLNIANAVIIDWPYTTLLETAVTDLPIICYKKYWSLRNGVEDLISKRCYLSENAIELKIYLERICNGTLSSFHDNEFIKQYGIHIGDSNSIGRATALIKNFEKNNYSSNIN